MFQIPKGYPRPRAARLDVLLIYTACHVYYSAITNASIVKKI